jgi:hypothetical protein
MLWARARSIHCNRTGRCAPQGRAQSPFNHRAEHDDAGALDGALGRKHRQISQRGLQQTLAAARDLLHHGGGPMRGQVVMKLCRYVGAAADPNISV